MKPIAIFYHCLFALGDPPQLLDSAWCVVREQMKALKDSGLLAVAGEFIVGMNGGKESWSIAKLALPSKAHIVPHGLQCKNECRTILLLEQWLPYLDDFYVLYFHAKNSVHFSGGENFARRWANCMLQNVVVNWKRCVKDLNEGAEAVGCHWMTGDKTPPGQSIFAGNHWWAKASFLRTLPSIMERPRIKESGLDSIESRYESEVWLGNGPRLPKIVDYHPGGPFDSRCPDL